MEAVENEDYVAALLRFRGGARGILEFSRASVGEQCTYGIEVHGSRGALSWDFRRMGELRCASTRTIRTPTSSPTMWHPVTANLPGSSRAGIAMGYDDLKVVEAHLLVESIATGKARGATMEDALCAAEIIEAMGESARNRGWVTLDG